MFHLTLLTGTNVAFSFHHERDTDFQVRDNKVVSDVTVCDFLLDGKQFSGLAVCASGDKFEKEVGRKIALKRAMDQAELRRELRSEIWGLYFNRFPDKNQPTVEIPNASL